MTIVGGSVPGYIWAGRIFILACVGYSRRRLLGKLFSPDILGHSIASKMRAPSFSILTTALLLAGGAVAGCHGTPTSCQGLDASIVAHTGTPVGKEVTYNNSEFG
jgi:hypothetical protein